MAIAASFPTIRPSLLLDFANSGVLDPRITFSRSTTATYYDGVTTAKAEQNLLTYSQQFDVSSNGWIKTGTTITADSVSAPDGTATADTLNEGTNTSIHGISQSAYSYTSGLPYTFSVYAKADTATVVQLLGQSAAFGLNVYANFDLASGVLGTVGADGTATITNVGGGWYRCTLTGTSIATTSQAIGFVHLCDNSTTSARYPSYTGSNKQLYIWGAQAEQRSAVTAYTPTTTQPITNYIPVLQTAAANVARFDHVPADNPTTGQKAGEALGLLIEEQRANLLTYSEDFGNAAWSIADATITSNIVIAPDGLLTGDKLIRNSGTGTNARLRRVSVVGAGTYTLTVYAKAAEMSFLVLTRDGLNSAWFNLSTGQLGTVDSGVTATIQNVGNGWYRCSWTYTSSISVTVAIHATTADGSFTSTGDGYSGIFIWGAQLEAGAFPTSYIATTSATVTRNADAASMTGTNFSSWFNAGEGTLYAESKGTLSSSTANFQVDDGSSNNRITIVGCNSATTGALVVVFGATQAANTANFTSGFDKNAFAYKVNDFKAYLNGASYLTDTSGNLPVVSTARIASNANTNSTTTIKKLAYYPERLTDANLQALTA